MTTSPVTYNNTDCLTVLRVSDTRLETWLELLFSGSFRGGSISILSQLLQAAHSSWLGASSQEYCFQMSFSCPTPPPSYPPPSVSDSASCLSFRIFSASIWPLQ